MRSFILRSIGEEEKEAEKEFEANFITRTVRSCQRQQSKEAKAEMQVRHRRGGLTKRRTASRKLLKDRVWTVSFSGFGHREMNGNLNAP